MDKTCIECFHFNPCVKCSENNVGVCDFGDCNLHKHKNFKSWLHALWLESEEF